MMILVTGATGLVGRALLARLLEAHAPVRALTRHPDSADLPREVEVATGDLAEPESLAAALSGVDRVYLFSAGRVGPGFAAMAKQAGIDRVVMVSGLDNDPASVEQPLTDAGLQWSHLRPTAFAANALRHWGHTIRAEGVVRVPYGDASIAPIHEADVADVAAALLLDDGPTGERHELTGPQSLTFRQQVAIIGEATGQGISFVEETPKEFRERMTRFVPAPIVDGMLVAWASTVGRPAVVTHTVERITGHPARSYAQWVSDHTADFR